MIQHTKTQPRRLLKQENQWLLSSLMLFLQNAEIWEPNMTKEACSGCRQLVRANALHKCKNKKARESTNNTRENLKANKKAGSMTLLVWSRLEKIKPTDFYHFVGPPLLLMTSRHLLFIVPISRRQSSGENSLKISWMVCQSWSMVVGRLVIIFAYILFQICSMGFRSGDWLGHVIDLMSRSTNHCLVDFRSMPGVIVLLDDDLSHHRKLVWAPDGGWVQTQGSLGNKLRPWCAWGGRAYRCLPWKSSPTPSSCRHHASQSSSGIRPCTFRVPGASHTLFLSFWRAGRAPHHSTKPSSTGLPSTSHVLWPISNEPLCWVYESTAFGCNIATQTDAQQPPTNSGRVKRFPCAFAERSCQLRRGLHSVFSASLCEAACLPGASFSVVDHSLACQRRCQSPYASSWSIGPSHGQCASAWRSRS